MSIVNNLLKQTPFLTTRGFYGEINVFILKKYCFNLLPLLVGDGYSGSLSSLYDGT